MPISDPKPLRACSEPEVLLPSKAAKVLRELVSLPTDRLWLVEEVAAYVRLGKSAVYKAARRGELPAQRGLGRWLRFAPEDVKAWAAGAP